ncbi:uncharacterized protein YdgA (DUF945 family) [Volucribacter psittacicida]|uniref:Uncharacterized protein YdgA (DUF945 family) n=1 Tax=Volucribacter psittacicida TaxID=203482 RepID=A0A4R1G8A4_9PAST|nr:YdgA family protein [Volucribacter psittacicida]TCK01949.1 uncharacterized protein YdgA (DUF945 family) [Volucribacter psittacicida]
MKKSTIAIGIIAVLGAVWTGAAWFTGSKAEEYYRQAVADANVQLQQIAESSNQALTLHINTLDFQRGIFSSQIKDELVINAEIKGEKRQWIVPFTDRLYHGPLPFNQLKTFNFMPNMVSWVSEATPHESIAPWFKATQGVSPVMMDFVVGYNQKATGVLKVADTDYSDSELHFVLQNLTLNIKDMDSHGTGKSQIHLGTLQLNTPTGESFALDKLDINADIKTLLANNFYIGEAQAQFAQLTLQADQQQVLVKEGKIAQNVEEKDEFIDIALSLKAKESYWQEKPLGEIKLLADFKHLEKQALIDFAQLPNIEQPTEEELSIYRQAEQKILQNQPHFILESSLENTAGELEAKVNIELSEPQQQSLTQSELLRLFKQFEIKLDLDKGALEQYTSILIQNILGLSEQQAQQDAQQFIREVIEGLQADNFIVDKDKEVKASLILEDGNMKLNGETLSEQQLQLLLFALMFGL